jgi:hypothetical protein
MKSIIYRDEFRYSSAQNETKGKKSKNVFPGRNNRIFFSIIGFVLLCFLSETAPAFTERNIVITLRNFFVSRHSQGFLDYSPMKEDGIPASEHVLIVKSSHCRDDAKDNDGNVYYFYMVDRTKGLKALVTEKVLDPAGDLDEYIFEFTELVKEEMMKDGGPAVIIKKFTKSSGVW